MDPLVYFDDNFRKYGPIFSLSQKEIYDAQILSYVATLPSETLMLVLMQIFLDHATKQINMYSNG